MNERLQKILSARGLASRRGAEELISAGRVTVNGAAAKLGDSADPDKDIIMVDGQPLNHEPEKVYIMLNKPRGYVTTLSDEKGRKTAASLVADCGKRVHPVGRLDMDSEGLLLFTNDGELTNRLTHPSYEKEKTYIVYVEGQLGDNISKLREPMLIDGYMTSGAKVSRLAEGRLKITIREGRNRQVRKMCAQVGLKVLRLIRVSEDGLELGKLPKGKWRYLEHWELERLKR